MACKLLYNQGCLVQLPSPPLSMPTTRPRLKLDEQTFEGLLAAAYTIQEHNERQRLSRQASASQPVPTFYRDVGAICPHCGARLESDGTPCPRCGPDPLRPGERMQRKFASLWDMIQNQGVRHEIESPEESVVDSPGPVPAASPAPSNGEIRILDVQEEVPSEETPSQKRDWFSQFPELADLHPVPVAPRESEAPSAVAVPGGMIEQLRQQWKALNLPKADVYLGLAILVAIVAILWPAPAAPQRPHLQPWQKILVMMGIAEAPPAPMHYRGDPNVRVWVDSHTALYYCPAEEHYGKGPNGHFTAQREAQLEQFEPASRVACQ